MRATAIVGFVVAAPLSAQTPASGRLLLGDVYSQVEQANPQIFAARSLAQAAEARVPGAGRPPDPRVQLGFMNYSLPGLSPMETVGMTQLQAMQMLPLGGKLSLARRVAGLKATASNERARELTWEVRNATAMAFYELYSIDRGIGVARETLRLLQDIEKTAAAMYRVAEGRQADVLRAQVEIAKMVEDTARMQSMRETMVAKLNALLDRTADYPIGEIALPLFPVGIPQRSSLDSVAYSGRRMIRAGIEEVRASEASEKLMQKEIWPDLEIGVQYAQRSGEMGTERMGSLMLGVSVPVFARDRQLRMRDEAAAMRQMAAAELASMRAETRGKIGEAYASLTRARTLARLYRTTVLPQAEATVASALSAYRVGQVDFMTLLDDRMTVKKYQQELYTLEADEGKAWAELEMLTGRELIDPNTNASQVTAPMAVPRGQK